MVEPTIDARNQHSSPRFIGDDTFASLQRRMKLEVIPDEIPIELTLAPLDIASVSLRSQRNPAETSASSVVAEAAGSG